MKFINFVGIIFIILILIINGCSSNKGESYRIKDILEISGKYSDTFIVILENDKKVVAHHSLKCGSIQIGDTVYKNNNGDYFEIC